MNGGGAGGGTGGASVIKIQLFINQNLLYDSLTDEGRGARGGTGGASVIKIQ